MLDKTKAFLARYGGLLIGAALIATIAGLVYAFGLNELDAETLAANWRSVSGRVAADPLRIGAIAAAFYMLLVIALLPGVPLMTIPFGLVFGWLGASLVVSAGMLAGVTILYFATTRLLPASFGGKAGGQLERLAGGVRENAVSYMLVLRLMPAVPFTLLNVALPALKIGYPAFVLTTLAGMLPRILAYAYAGEGLRGVISERLRECPPGQDGCAPALSAGDFLTPEVLLATGLLGLVAMLPIAIRWLGARRKRAGL
ncbi:DedA family protein [Arsenicitalea aurantiaca]|uniref:TVP38/TMEM64 family membrane protein n=1 Tax=Arsenicitalea aurantiaca TaxID=1783274 RepID=A0A433XBD1_9HYPH|nr:VTT domain-containing protein [Arsenicitalea aurantiaca]RUT31372.1 DedA family protein [Arsenicitalea aurantiaca]